MGTQFLTNLCSKMKLLAVLALTLAIAYAAPEGKADAEAEADPYYYYSNYYRPAYYSGYRRYGLYGYGYGYPYSWRILRRPRLPPIRLLCLPLCLSLLLRPLQPILRL